MAATLGFRLGHISKMGKYFNESLHPVLYRMSDFVDLEAVVREISVESVPEVNDALRVGNPTAIPSFRSDALHLTTEDRERFGRMANSWRYGRPRVAPVRRRGTYRRTYKRARAPARKRPYKRFASRYRRYNTKRRYMVGGRRRVYGRRRFRR